MGVDVYQDWHDDYRAVITAYDVLKQIAKSNDDQTREGVFGAWGS